MSGPKPTTLLLACLVGLSTGAGALRWLVAPHADAATRVVLDQDPAPEPLHDLEIAPDAPRLEGNAANGELPSLEVTPDAPRLEGVEATTAPAMLADNSFCFVCHGNYRQEHLASRHATEGIGCADCHGPSFAHRNDENHTTPPDVMFPARSIDRACRECHATHDVPPRTLIARFLERCPDQTRASAVVCTDCHGEHRLARRIVRWDKQTRALITDTPPTAGE
jgi:hypothetical protein